jgi:hypothetical protein
LETVDEGLGVGIENLNQGRPLWETLVSKWTMLSEAWVRSPSGWIDSLVGVRDRHDLVSLIGKSAGLDALQAASGSVGSLALGEVDAESEGDDLSDVARKDTTTQSPILGLKQRRNYEGWVLRRSDPGRLHKYFNSDSR